jgi:DNA-binding Lrp family transcriptional regulator
MSPCILRHAGGPRRSSWATARGTVADFERGLAEIAEVRHAERLFGDSDYLIRVATADIAAYQNLRDERLATLPGVQRLTSTIVMKRIVDERLFPIAPPSPRPRPKRKR